MQSFLYIIIFIFGLVVGSFLNCVIYRLEINQSFLSGRSYCPNCKHKLGFFDLIPVFSFVFLKGRCRYCRQRISLQYPLVEITTGILFLLIGLQFLNGSMVLWLILLYLLFITPFFIIIFFYDLKHYIIPDRVVFTALLVSSIWYLVAGIFFDFYTKYQILNTILAAFGASTFFFIIVLISRGKWMGIGDIKLAFLMGIFLGFPKILVALFSAFFFGAIIGIGLIILKKKDIKSEIPFGPFLVAGTLLSLFLGQKIINWYLNFLPL